MPLANVITQAAIKFIKIILHLKLKYKGLLWTCRTFINFLTPLLVITDSVANKNAETLTLVKELMDGKFFPPVIQLIWKPTMVLFLLFILTNLDLYFYSRCKSLLLCRQNMDCIMCCRSQHLWSMGCNFAISIYFRLQGLIPIQVCCLCLLL